MTLERALNVAEKPSIAKSISNILSHGSAIIRNGVSKYNKNFDFGYNLHEKEYEMTMTSVAGHLMALDFPESYQRWTNCSVIDLFTAPVVKSVSKVSCNRTILFSFFFMASSSTEYERGTGQFRKRSKRM
jgi:DNA topoisomerase IA